MPEYKYPEIALHRRSLRLRSWLNKQVHRFGVDDRSVDKARLLRRFWDITGRQFERDQTLNDLVTSEIISDEAYDPLRQFVTDKEFGKFYAKGVLDEDLCPETFGVLESKTEVDTYAFPDRCVIKATHGCGQTILRRAGEPIDTDLVKSWFDYRYDPIAWERNYQYLKAKVIVEEMVFDGEPFVDLQIFFQRGTPLLIFHKQIQDPGGNKKMVLRVMDVDWTLFELGLENVSTDGFALSDLSMEHPGPAPATYQKILDYSSKLSERFSIIRVDWMLRGDEFYLGELTNFFAAGARRFPSLDIEKRLAHRIKFPKNFK